MVTKLEVSPEGKDRWIGFGEVAPDNDDFIEDRSAGSPRLIIFSCAEENHQSSISQVPIGPHGIIDMRKEQVLMPDLKSGDSPFEVNGVKLEQFPFLVNLRATHI